jgi:hypothetical protein
MSERPANLSQLATRYIHLLPLFLAQLLEPPLVGPEPDQEEEVFYGVFFVGDEILKFAKPAMGPCESEDAKTGI